MHMVSDSEFLSSDYTLVNFLLQQFVDLINGCLSQAKLLVQSLKFIFRRDSNTEEGRKVNIFLLISYATCTELPPFLFYNNMMVVISPDHSQLQRVDNCEGIGWTTMVRYPRSKCNY